MKKLKAKLSACWDILFGSADRFILISLDERAYTNLRKQVEEELPVPVKIGMSIVDIPYPVAGLILDITNKNVTKMIENLIKEDEN